MMPSLIEEITQLEAELQTLGEERANIMSAERPNLLAADALAEKIRIRENRLSSFKAQVEAEEQALWQQFRKGGRKAIEKVTTQVSFKEVPPPLILT